VLSIICIFENINLTSFLGVLYSPKYVISVISSFFAWELPLFYINNSMVKGKQVSNYSENIVSSKSNSINIFETSFNYNSMEVSNSLRFVKYHNPLINYSYKSGNYVGIWDKLYPSLITSFIEVTKNVIKAP
jgi:hypothetical protein